MSRLHKPATWGEAADPTQDVARLGLEAALETKDLEQIQEAIAQYPNPPKQLLQHANAVCSALILDQDVQKLDADVWAVGKRRIGQHYFLICFLLGLFFVLTILLQSVDDDSDHTISDGVPMFNGLKIWFVRWEILVTVCLCVIWSFAYGAARVRHEARSRMDKLRDQVQCNPRPNPNPFK